MVTIIGTNIIDVVQKTIGFGEIEIREGRIFEVRKTNKVSKHHNYILPGLVDAHVHIESSMLVPTEFARLAVVHGTVATVSDPHEIANVCGLKGVEYMLENAARSPFKFCFGAPSCVPATAFETAGATISPADIRFLLEEKGLSYLSEMMNWPGVLYKDPEVMEKIRIAHQLGKPVDGHAPGLKGKQAADYAAAGISTDHECFTAEEAADKLAAGMKILIREGSAAKNFEALAPLIPQYYPSMMFCSDDKHPDELIHHHIDELVRRTLKKGYDLFSVLQIACVNPVRHYGLPVGLLQPGDPADFIEIDHPDSFVVKQTWIDGEKVSYRKASLLPHVEERIINHFKTGPCNPIDFAVKAEAGQMRVIQALNGEIITESLTLNPNVQDGYVQTDTDADLLKIAVVNRYQEAPPAVAFIKGFGLKRGAVASTVAHDSHNIVAVGTSDKEICRVVNLLIAHKGGIAVTDGQGQDQVLPLPVAGLMTTADGYQTAQDYARLDQMTKELGSTLSAPFMTLSFMALLVIPSLKLSDKGLFDGTSFQFTPLFVQS